MSSITIYWLAFIAIFAVVYAIDLSLTSLKGSTLSLRSSLSWTAVWVSVALLFGLSLALLFPLDSGSAVRTGPVMASKFIAGYFTEYSLSVDNLFVFILIFFNDGGIKADNQPKLLKLGILISIALRVLFIIAGMELVEKFHWLIYILGCCLFGQPIKWHSPKRRRA